MKPTKQDCSHSFICGGISDFHGSCRAEVGRRRTHVANLLLRFLRCLCSILPLTLVHGWFTDRGFKNPMFSRGVHGFTDRRHIVALPRQGWFYSLTALYASWYGSTLQKANVSGPPYGFTTRRHSKSKLKNFPRKMRPPISFHDPELGHSTVANLESNHFIKPGVLATIPVKLGVAIPGAFDVRRCAAKVLECAAESHQCAVNVQSMCSGCASMCSKNEVMLDKLQQPGPLSQKFCFQ